MLMVPTLYDPTVKSRTELIYLIKCERAKVSVGFSEPNSVQGFRVQAECIIRPTDPCPSVAEVIYLHVTGVSFSPKISMKASSMDGCVIKKVCICVFNFKGHVYS